MLSSFHLGFIIKVTIKELLSKISFELCFYHSNIDTYKKNTVLFIMCILYFFSWFGLQTNLKQ